MIFGSTFYHQLMRRYIITFGNMFNDLVVQRLDSTSTRIQNIAVPLVYSPVQKFIARLEQDPSLTRQVAIQLPAMSFEMINMTYDGTRRLTSTTKNVISYAKNVRYQFVPVPYNMEFQLYVYVKNADEGAQIIEQIVPYFGPEWTNSINLVPNMNIIMDVPCVLDGITLQDTYDGDFTSRRAMIYTLSFTMKGYFYGPIHPREGDSKVIKKIQLDFMTPTSTSNTVTGADISTTGRTDRIILTAGLLANGVATTNSAASISYTLVSANSNFGITSNNFFFVDGLKYRPVTGNDS